MDKGEGFKMGDIHFSCFQNGFQGVLDAVFSPFLLDCSLASKVHVKNFCLPHGMSRRRG